MTKSNCQVEEEDLLISLPQNISNAKIWLEQHPNLPLIVSADRIRIENNRIAEDSNTSTGTANPQGTPCK